MAARRKKPPTDPAPADHPPVTAAAPDTLPPPPSSPPEVEPTGAAEPTQPATPTGDGPRRPWQPDPFPLLTISLGPDTGGPRMTLLRSAKLNQVAIRFDEKPEEEYRLRLREAGWKWREDEGVWTRQLDRERRAATYLEAERLFSQIADAIRTDRGLTGRSGVGG